LKNTCIGLHTETMLEMIVDSIFSSRNIHEVDNNSNYYRNMMTDGMWINYCYSGKGSCVNEESNVDATRVFFFYLLKDSNEPLWNGYTNYNKLSIIAWVFVIKSDYGISEAGYDSIIRWAKNILLEKNKLKENFYAANL